MSKLSVYIKELEDQAIYNQKFADALARISKYAMPILGRLMKVYPEDTQAYVPRDIFVSGDTNTDAKNARYKWTSKVTNRGKKPVPGPMGYGVTFSDALANGVGVISKNIFKGKKYSSENNIDGCTMRTPEQEVKIVIFSIS